MERMRPNSLPSMNEGGELHAPSCLAQQDQARQESQSTGSGHEQGLKGCTPGGFPSVIEADEQVGADAGELPKDEEDDPMISQHNPQHGPHEEEEGAEKTPALGVIFQVIAGINADQCTDTADKQSEEHTQPIQGKVQADLRRWGPWGLEDETLPPQRSAGRIGQSTGSGGRGAKP